MIGAGVATQAGLLVAREPGRRVAARRPARGSRRRPRAARDRGVQPLRHGVPLRGRRVEASVLPHPLATTRATCRRRTRDRADRVARTATSTVYAVPPLQPRRGDRACPARRRERQRADLGPAGVPEGGGVRGRTRDRRVRGAGRRGRDPQRPQPHGDPRPDRGRRGRRAEGAATPRTRRATTTATTASTWTGTRSRATPQPGRVAEGVGATASVARGVRGEARRRTLGRRWRPARRWSEPVNYGRYG